MAQIIGLPKLSPTMEEGVLLRWVKKEGDAVAPGDLVAEVETDKANMDFNMEDEGVLLKLLVNEGDTVRLGAPVAILGQAGEDITALLAEAQGGGKPAAPSKPTQPATKPVAAQPEAKPVDEKKPAAAAKPAADQPAAVASSTTTRPQLLASPLAKTLAIELGVDLRTVEGSGPGGRIVERDVKAAADGTAPTRASSDDTALAVPPKMSNDSSDDSSATSGRHALVRAAVRPANDADSAYLDHPASNMRRRIADRLTEAKRDVPHFYLNRTINAAPLLAFRSRLNELLGDRGKVSVNDLVLKATALALRRVPACNAAWIVDDAGVAVIRQFERVHIGVAVAIEDGLVTPVVRDADLKGIGAIGLEVRDLAERARNRQLKGHEISGSTFTISNLGMFGIERFTAIINPPEAGILAVGAILDEPMVKDGVVVAGKRMTVSMSCDHRVIDGALGAQWLVAFADLIEHPESLAL